MRLLVLGGTAFLGRAVARAGLDAGHDVTCLARGTSPVLDGARFVRADRDDPAAGLGGVETERWDAVVDVSRQPGQVRRSARLLAATGAHYVFVSTANVYADHATPGADEDAPLLDPHPGDVMADMSEYGPAKVACEEHVLAAYGPKGCLIARAGLIGGPGDPSGRSGYWPWRLAHPSNAAKEVLLPDAATFPAQLVDVRDLAAWLVRCGEQRTAGAVDALGPTRTFGDVVEAAREAARSDAVTVAASTDWLLAQGVQEWMGPRSLPLWIGDPDFAGFTSRRGDRARGLGLSTRPLVETLRDTLAWEEDRPVDAPRGAGLTDEEERALLADLPR